MADAPVNGGAVPNASNTPVNGGAVPNASPAADYGIPGAPKPASWYSESYELLRLVRTLRDLSNEFAKGPYGPQWDQNVDGSFGNISRRIREAQENGSIHEYDMGSIIWEIFVIALRRQLGPERYEAFLTMMPPGLPVVKTPTLAPSSLLSQAFFYDYFTQGSWVSSRGVSRLLDLLEAIERFVFKDNPGAALRLVMQMEAPQATGHNGACQFTAFLVA